MIMRGSRPRALTASGALVVLGVGLLLLPLLPTWAQEPGEARGQEPGPKVKDFQETAAKLKAIWADLEKQRQDLGELEKRLASVLMEIQRLQRELAGQEPGFPPPGFPGPFPPGGPNKGPFGGPGQGPPFPGAAAGMGPLPRLEKIAFSKADADTLVTVTGQPEAVPPHVTVVILSLQTGAMARTTADARGAFRARVVAPDGSTLVINYGHPGLQNRPDGSPNPGFQNWLENSSALMLTVNPRPPLSPPFQGGAGGVEVPFTSAGGLGMGYWIAEGVQKGTNFKPGDTIEYLLTFSTSPGIDVPDNPQPPQLSLARISDVAGRAVMATFVPTLLTPTGLPIFTRAGYEHDGLRFEGKILNVQRAGQRKLVTVSLSRRIPENLPAGHYVGRIQWQLPMHHRLAPPTGRNEIEHGGGAQSLTPVLRIGAAAPPRIPWVLLGNTLSNGTRGVVAREDKSSFDFGTKVTFNANKFIIPKDTSPLPPFPGVGKGEARPVKYRLEPFLPTVSFIFGGPARPVPPLVGFSFPSGELQVTVQRPDGQTDDLGKKPFRCARCKGPDERGFGMASLNALYELTTLDRNFEYEFPTYGHYVVTMQGWLQDAGGTKYHGGGAYDVYVAKTLDLDLGTFLGTPFQVGDEMSPVVHVRPMVPAEVQVDLKLFPNSEAKKLIQRTVSGRANAYGYFHPGAPHPTLSPGGRGKGEGAEKLTLNAAGEYVVDVTASYTDTDGVLWMGAARGASVVETPNTKLIARGKRGLTNPNHNITDRPAWFTMRNIDPGGSEERQGTPVPQAYYPYFSGDVVWATDGTASGIFPVITLHDPEKITKLGRFDPSPQPLSPRERGRGEGNGEATGEIEVAFPPSPLSPTLSPEGRGRGEGGLPAVQYPELIKTWAYYYISTQRPGVTVRSLVGSGEVQRAYWQFGDPYNLQLGNGPEGDLPGDIKLQYGGLVYRDTEAGINQYAIYGSMTVMIPLGTKRGMRTFPPFQGAAGGPNGGPLLTLKGQDIDIFFTPVGVMPGTVLEVGDTCSLAGPVWPTLPSLVEATVTAPSGKQHTIKTRANKIGHVHVPSANFVVDEPGVHTVNVRVTHDGMTSAGQVEKPYPTGGVLGSDDGTYVFYVVPKGSAKALVIDTPSQGALLEGVPPLGFRPGQGPEGGKTDKGKLEGVPPLGFRPGPPPGRRPEDRPFVIKGIVPENLKEVAVHYTVNLTGTVLESGTLPVEQGTFTYAYDLRKLNKLFANLDLDGADTVVVSLVVTGRDSSGKLTAVARQVLFQGREVLALTPR